MVNPNLITNVRTRLKTLDKMVTQRYVGRIVTIKSNLNGHGGYRAYVSDVGIHGTDLSFVTLPYRKDGAGFLKLGNAIPCYRYEDLDWDDATQLMEDPS